MTDLASPLPVARRRAIAFPAREARLAAGGSGLIALRLVEELLDVLPPQGVSTVFQQPRVRVERRGEEIRGGEVVGAGLLQPVTLSDQIAAHLIWMGEEPLLPGRSYLMKAGARTVGAAVTELKHQVDVDTFKTLAAAQKHERAVQFFKRR